MSVPTRTHAWGRLGPHPSVRYRARPMRPVGSIYPCLGPVSVSLKHHQTEKSCSAIDSGNDNASSLFQTISGVTPTLRQSRLLSPVLRVPSTTGLSLSISLEKPRGRPYSPSGRGQSSRATSPSERQILVVCVPPFMHRMRPCAFRIDLHPQGPNNNGRSKTPIDPFALMARVPPETEKHGLRSAPLCA